MAITNLSVRCEELIESSSESKPSPMPSSCRRTKQECQAYHDALIMLPFILGSFFTLLHYLNVQVWVWAVSLASLAQVWMIGNSFVNLDMTKTCLFFQAMNWIMLISHALVHISVMNSVAEAEDRLVCDVLAHGAMNLVTFSYYWIGRDRPSSFIPSVLGFVNILMIVYIYLCLSPEFISRFDGLKRLFAVPTWISVGLSGVNAFQVGTGVFIFNSDLLSSKKSTAVTEKFAISSHTFPLCVLFVSIVIALHLNGDQADWLYEHRFVPNVINSTFGLNNLFALASLRDYLLSTFESIAKRDMIIPTAQSHSPRANVMYKIKPFH